MSIVAPRTMTSTPASASRPLRVAVLGCSGSIGTQTLDVCRMHADRLDVVALSVHGSTDALVRAAREFGPTTVAVTSEDHAHDAVLDELPDGCELTFGPESIVDICRRDDVDCVVVAVIGAAGLRACYEALRANKIVACANKEPLVLGGDILMPLARPGRLLPVDSEHSAIFQCLDGSHTSALRRVWLTCSGGPFFGLGREELAHVTCEQALAHPSWTMGPKITVDSATLMNKGLEVIEAHHLFDVDVADIQVLVHRSSRIHSMCEFADGSVIAQMGPSDMRIPIQYALSYPERWDSPADPVNFLDEPPLTFDRPDLEAFGCLRLAIEAGTAGGTLPCAMNAANEVANEAFRNGACGFLDIEAIVQGVMDAHDNQPATSLEQLEDVDARSREAARRLLAEVR